MSIAKGTSASSVALCCVLLVAMCTERCSAVGAGSNMWYTSVLSSQSSMLAAQQHLQQQGVPAPGTGAGVAAGGGGGAMRTAAGTKAGVGAAADPAPNSEESSMRGRWPPVALQVDTADAGASDGAVSAARAEAYSPEARCSALDPMLSSRRQRELCRRSFRTLVVLAQGAGIAIEECQFQFRYSRWNCSILSGPNLFGKLTTLKTRETAYIFAITSAAVMYAATRACARGDLPECGCDQTVRPRLSDEPNVTFEWGGCSHDVAYGDAFARQYLDLMAAPPEPSPAPAQDAAQSAWPNSTAARDRGALRQQSASAPAHASGRGSGRGLTGRRVRRAAQGTRGRGALRARLRAEQEVPPLAAAAAVTEGAAGERRPEAAEPTTTTKTETPPIRSAAGGARRTRLSNLIDSWNNNAGRRVKMCWRVMSDFRVIGALLKDRYDSAVGVEVGPRGRLRIAVGPSDDSDAGGWSAGGRNPPVRFYNGFGLDEAGSEQNGGPSSTGAQLGVVSSERRLTRRDLAYSDESPDFCSADAELGLRGTRGRECSRTSRFADNCAILCCGRGARTQETVIEEQCLCKFVWCCRVECKNCTRRVRTHTCY